MKKNLKVIFHLSILFLALLIFSCGKENRWDCVKRTGEKTTDTRILPPFKKIYLKDNVNVFITQGNAQEVKVEAGKNLASLIKTEVVDGILHINNDNRCNWARSYKNGEINIYITLQTIREIWHFGSGQIKSEGIITCDTLDVWAHQTGDVELTVDAQIVYPNMHTTADLTLHGKSALLGIWHMGEGFLHCEDLQAGYIWSYSKASGDQYLNPTVAIDATIDWVGNIYYSGAPVATIQGTGTGKLIRKN